MNKKQKNGLLVLTECSIMIALATVLSVIQIFEMPYGGSVTLASMLPIVIVAYRHGVLIGSGSALAASVIQLLLGMKNFYYFSTWQSIIALAVFDYLLAFTVFGLVGLLRGKIKNQSAEMAIGALIASVIRYLCHVISGATIWAGLSIPTEAALVYSLSYNATYMIPDALVLVLSAAYIGASLDFTKRIPKRIHAEHAPVASYCYIGAGLAALAALITDTGLVFSKLQNAESGELSMAGMGDVNWVAFAIVTAIAAVVVAALILFGKSKEKKPCAN